MYTITLKKLINYLTLTEQTLFDFDYTFTDVVRGDLTIDKEYIEDLFINYYEQQQINGVDDVEFKFYLRRLWLKKCYTIK